MANRILINIFIVFFINTLIKAQVIELNKIILGSGYEYNVFGSPRINKSNAVSLIKNDYYHFVQNNLQVSKIYNNTKHKISLKTFWYNYDKFKILNNSNINFKYSLKHTLSEKTKLELDAEYTKKKALRTNILGEPLRFAHNYYKLNINPKINYKINSFVRFKIAYNYASYFYQKEINDYNFCKNVLFTETNFSLKNTGTNNKRLKILFDVAKRNYLHKISRNRLGIKSDDNKLWRWTYYNAAVEYFEEVDIDRELKLKYEVVFRNDNFEGYYNYTEQNLQLNYVYFFDYENSISLNAQVGYRKYKYRITSDNQNLSISYPQVDVQYKHLINSQLAFHLNLQTYSRNFNLEEVESLTRRNYFSFYVEALLSCNFTKKN